MRDKFDHFYRPNQKRFKQMWRSGVFVFDASALLNLYRYSPATRMEWLGVMSRLADRIWLPYQAALEFHSNRLGVIHQQLKNHQQITEAISDAERELETRIRHLYRDTAVEDDVVSKMREHFAKLRKDIGQSEEEQIPETNSPEADSVLASITELFENRVGDPLGNESSEEFAAEGRERYENQVPPGYRDSEKTANQLGDLIFWFQLIAEAQAGKRPVLLVTDDQKSDWWVESGGKKIGPRPELIREMREKADCEFYAYTPDQFLTLSRDYLKANVSSEAIGEVSRISLGDYLAAEEIRALRYELSQTQRRMREWQVRESISVGELRLIERMKEELNLRLTEHDELLAREADIQATLASATPEDRTESLETELTRVQLMIQENEMEIDRVKAGLDRRRKGAAEFAESSQQGIRELTERLGLLQRRLVQAEQQLPPDVVQRLRNEPPTPRRRRRGGSRRTPGEAPTE